MFIKRCSRSIFLQVVIGLVIGVICGVGIPDLAVQMKPLGDGFIKLIKMRTDRLLRGGQRHLRRR